MQLKPEDVFKVEVLTITEFCAKQEGIKSEAVYYAIKHGLVDYIPIGRTKLIVLTDHTRQYKPNSHPLRKPKGKRKSVAK